ncbi:MAG TPA: DUF6338 family protein [Acidobacteriaceae bacterium]|nr:DUF6338 family protein [Acidobacteriaceae bacterium]
MIARQMPASVAGLGILLILLPGFSCAFLVQRIAVRAKQTELDKVVEALLLSFVLYITTLPFFGYSLPVSWTSADSGNFAIYVIRFNWRHLLALGLGAIGLALLYAANINRDWLLTLLRKCNLTERTARSSIWNDTFQDIKLSYVTVGLEDGRSVLGYLRYYSDDWQDASLFLEDAAWVDKDGNQIPIDGPGILLTRESKIVFVAFLNPREAEASPNE